MLLGNDPNLLLYNLYSLGITNFILPALFIKAAMVTDSALPEDLFFKNYTVGVLSYLVCHIAVFVWSFATAAPVNSNLVYLPGILQV